MIILHFDLQPQFKYMNYFIYTSHHKWLSLVIPDDFEKAVNKQSPARAVGKELQVSIICVSPAGITDYIITYAIKGENMGLLKKFERLAETEV